MCIVSAVAEALLLLAQRQLRWVVHFVERRVRDVEQRLDSAQVAEEDVDFAPSRSAVRPRRRARRAVAGLQLAWAAGGAHRLTEKLP